MNKYGIWSGLNLLAQASSGGRQVITMSEQVMAEKRRLANRKFGSGLTSPRDGAYVVRVFLQNFAVNVTSPTSRRSVRQAFGSK